MTTAILLIGMIVCIFLSSFFSSSEIALSSANEIRLENEAEKGNKGAKTALKLISDFDGALAAILIGNNLVNIASSSISTVLVILILKDPSKSWVATVVTTLLVIIFGETIPKITAKQNATSLSIRYAPVIRAIEIALKPLLMLVVGLIGLLTRGIKTDENEGDPDDQVEELHNIIENAEGEGVLDKGEKDLLIAAIDFDDVCAYEVMTARVDMEAIDIADDMDTILDFVEHTTYTRIPVYEDSIDNIIGVLHLNAFLRACAENGKENVDLKSLLLEPVFVYKTTKLPIVLSVLRESQQHIAIVTDEYSGTYGLISLEDVMEQIVGDIWDEDDQIEEDIVRKNEKEFEIDGDMSIYDFIDLMGINEEDFDFDSDTVGGWAMEMLEHFPEPGESFDYEDKFTIRILEAEDRRVGKLLVILKQPLPDAEIAEV